VRKIGITTISRSVPVLEGTTYLLRSISYHKSDIMVAIYVDSILPDGDCILAWKTLHLFDVPFGER